MAGEPRGLRRRFRDRTAPEPGRGRHRVRVRHRRPGPYRKALASMLSEIFDSTAPPTRSRYAYLTCARRNRRTRRASTPSSHPIATSGSAMGTGGRVHRCRAGPSTGPTSSRPAQGVRGAEAQLRHGPVPAGAGSCTATARCRQALGERRRAHLARRKPARRDVRPVLRARQRRSVSMDAELRRRLKVAESEAADHPRGDRRPPAQP